MHRINLRGPWQCISTEHNHKECLRLSRNFHRPTRITSTQSVLLFIAYHYYPERVLLNEGELRLDPLKGDFLTSYATGTALDFPVNVGRIEIGGIMDGYNCLSVDWSTDHGVGSFNVKPIRLPNVDTRCPLNDVWLMIVDP